MYFIKTLVVSLWGDNLVVVALIYKNWIPSGPYHVKSSNIFLHHICILMFLYIKSVCLQVIKITFILAFLPDLREFSLVSLYLFEETYASLESPVHPEYNGFCPNSVN